MAQECASREWKLVDVGFCVVPCVGDFGECHPAAGEYVDKPEAELVACYLNSKK